MTEGCLDWAEQVAKGVRGRGIERMFYWESHKSFVLHVIDSIPDEVVSALHAQCSQGSTVCLSFSNQNFHPTTRLSRGASLCSSLTPSWFSLLALNILFSFSSVCEERGTRRRTVEKESGSPGGEQTKKKEREKWSGMSFKPPFPSRRAQHYLHQTQPLENSVLFRGGQRKTLREKKKRAVRRAEGDGAYRQGIKMTSLLVDH